MKKIDLFFLPVLLFSAASAVHAGGFRVSLQGQKAQGMGHASVALSESTETIFFNPAGLTYIDKSELVVGISAVNADNNYQNADLGITAETDNPISTPLNVYWGQKFGDKGAIGVGLYTPFGSRVDWPTDWAGSHLVNNIELQSIFIQPTYAIDINDRVSLGAGAIVSVSAIEFNRNLSTSLINENGDRSNVTISDSGIVDFGLNLGALFTISDKWSVGVNYRTEIEVKSKGDAEFANIPNILSTTFQNGGYTAEIPLPAEFTVGMRYQHNDRLTFVADYNYTFWDAYESLDIDFSNEATPDSVNPRSYKNSSIYRIGLQYAYSDVLILRGGIYYDETPIRDGFFAPETPRGDQIGLTAGLSYQFKDNIEFDFSGILLDFDQVDSSYDPSDEGPFEGSYTTSTWILGAGTTVQF